MNENLNLVEILKDCPEGTKLYSTVFGEVKLKEVGNTEYPILLETMTGLIKFKIAQDGRYFSDFNGECTLFPSKEHRDWSKFKPKKPKFDPNTLRAFDKILGRSDTESPWLCHRHWYCAIFSHIDNSENYPIKTVGDSYKYAVPYNDKTKHLVGTSDEAPEYYRYWED